MSDLLGQALLLQARQPRRESAQSRLAAQMLAGMNAPPNMGGPLDVLNRASAGIFGTLMAQRAEAEQRAREKQDMGAIFDYQNEQQRRLQQYYSGNLGAPDAAPAAPAGGGMGAMTPAAPAPQGDGRAPVPPGVTPGSFPNRPEDRGPTIPNPDFNPNAPEGPSNPRTIANPWHDLRGQLPPASGQVWNPNPGQPLPTRAGETTTRAPGAPAPQAATTPPVQQPPRPQPTVADDGMTPDMRMTLARINAGMQSGDPAIMAAAQRDLQMLRAQQDINMRIASDRRAEEAARRAEEAANRETFGEPRPVQRNGRTVMVQVGNRGTVREIPDVSPATRETDPQDVRVLGALMAPDADPSSAEYAANYWYLTRPRPQTIIGVNGEQLTVMMPQELPPSVRPPTFGLPAAAPQAAAPALVPGPRADLAPQGPAQMAPALDASAPLLGQLPAQPMGAQPAVEAPPSAQPSGAQIPGLPANARVIGGARTNPLSDSAQRQLTDLGRAFDEWRGLTQTFRPDYAGFGSDLVGNTINTIARNTPGASPRADWWQRYNLLANIERNELFGSALTAGEQQAWRSAMIGPGMNPDQIRLNIARQNQIAETVIMRRARAAIANGTNPRAVSEATGIPLDRLTGEPAAAPSGPPPLPPGNWELVR